jgi:uncharacterized protein (TIGR02217 family)
MAIHNVVYPLDVRSMAATPVWPVDVIKMGGGAEQRILLQSDSKREYEGGHGILTIADAQVIHRFFSARRAQVFGFKLVDKSLFQAVGQPFGTGGGIGSTNQLIVNEGDATNAYNREIYLPKPGTVQIFGNAALKTEGVNYTLNYGTSAAGGLVTWLTSVSGQALTWTGEFYIPVRFDVSSLPDIEILYMMSSNTGGVQGPTVPMVEIDFPSEW